MTGFAIAADDTAGDVFAQQAFSPDAPTPFWGAVGAGWQDAFDVRRLGAREAAQDKAFWDRHRDIERRTGQRLPPLRLGDRDIDLGEDPVNLALAGQSGPLSDAYEAAIDKLRRDNPQAMAGVPTHAEIRARTSGQLRAIAGRAEQAGRDHPVAAFTGQALGTIADPFNLAGGVATAPLAAGRPIVTRMLAQAAANAGVEALQAPARAVSAANSGGPAYGWREGAADVGTAFFAGGLFEGAGALVGRGWRALRPELQADPLARAAAEAGDQAARDDLAVTPAQDGGDYEAGLDALQRGGPRPEVTPRRDLEELFPAGSTPLGDQGAVSVSGEADYRGRRIFAASFDPVALEVDPARFQYKASGDAEGLTARLKGVEAWDATASGKALVWQDAEGRSWVADGHQRRGLAKRMVEKGWDARLDGYLFREADGWTATQVRTVAALKNIREGSGTILDAAKIFRDAPEAARDASLPVSGEFMAQARALARLEGEAFGAVVNDVIPARYGAAIGEMAGDRPDLHRGLVKLMRDGEPASIEEAQSLVREGLLDDWVSAQGAQADMFGGLAPEATTIARAKVKAAVLRALRRDATVLQQLVRHADAIEAGGNILARDANEQMAAITSAALEIISKLSLRGGEIGEAVAEAARRVTAGHAAGDAAKGLISRVKSALKSGEAIDGLRLTTIDPKAPSPAAREAVAGFDKPGGPAVEAQLREAPEDADLMESGLFDDLPVTDAADRAHQHLLACAPE